MKEQVWKSIADFILTGNLAATVEMEKEKLIADKQNKWLCFFSSIAPVVWIGIIIVLVITALFLASLPIDEWQKTLILVGYALVIWTILTKV